ncbi:hypothetical protein AMTRI_Chr10g225900 [Amborella trichopoda]
MADSRSTKQRPIVLLAHARRFFRHPVLFLCFDSRVVEEDFLFFRIGVCRFLKVDLLTKHSLYGRISPTNHSTLFNSIPWIVMGYFNAVRDPSEIDRGKNQWCKAIRQCDECLIEAELEDLSRI